MFVAWSRLGKKNIPVANSQSFWQQLTRHNRAFVVIGDLDEAAGKRFEEEHAGCVLDLMLQKPKDTSIDSLRACKFVKCDMTEWHDQLAMFKTALSSSPRGKVDIVIANAGISGYDSVFFNDSKPRASTAVARRMKYVRPNRLLLCS